MDNSNQVLRTTKTALDDILNMSNRNNVVTLGAEQDAVNSNIRVLQTLLTKARIQYTQFIVKATGESLETIKSVEKYQSKDPIQSFERIEFDTPDPNQLVAYYVNKLKQPSKRNSIPGLFNILKEGQDIEFKIKSLSRQLSDSKKKKQYIEKQLKNIETKDIELSRIKNSQMGYYFQLYSIHKEYRDITVGPDGKTKYSSDPKLVRKQQQLSRLFVAKIYEDKEGRFLKDPLKLDVNNPGASVNEIILVGEIDAINSITSDLKVADEIQKDIDKLNKVMTDSKDSEGLSTKPDAPKIPTGETTEEENESTVKTATEFLGLTFPNKDEKEAYEKWWADQMSELSSLGFVCGGQKKKDSEQEALEEKKAENAAAEADAQKKFKEKIEKETEGQEVWKTWDTITGIKFKKGQKTTWGLYGVRVAKAWADFQKINRNPGETYKDYEKRRNIAFREEMIKNSPKYRALGDAINAGGQLNVNV